MFLLTTRLTKNVWKTKTKRIKNLTILVYNFFFNKMIFYKHTKLYFFLLFYFLIFSTISMIILFIVYLFLRKAYLKQKNCKNNNNQKMKKIDIKLLFKILLWICNPWFEKWYSLYLLMIARTIWLYYIPILTLGAAAATSNFNKPEIKKSSDLDS